MKNIKIKLLTINILASVFVIGYFKNIDSNIASALTGTAYSNIVISIIYTVLTLLTM